MLYNWFFLSAQIQQSAAFYFKAIETEGQILMV